MSPKERVRGAAQQAITAVVVDGQETTNDQQLEVGSARAALVEVIVRYAGDLSDRIFRMNPRGPNKSDDTARTLRRQALLVQF